MTTFLVFRTLPAPIDVGTQKSPSGECRRSNDIDAGLMSLQPKDFEEGANLNVSNHVFFFLLQSQNYLIGRCEISRVRPRGNPRGSDAGKAEIGCPHDLRQ